MEKIEVSPQLTVTYDTAGQGTPLILLHAFPLNRKMWASQIEYFSKHHRVIAPDFRGMGGSTPFENSPSIQTLANDLYAFLETLRIDERIILAGLSVGGYVAFEFARAYPEKLRALILCDTRADADTPENTKTRNEMIAFAKEHSGGDVVTKMLPKLISPSTLEDQHDVVTQIQQIAQGNSGEQLAQLFTAIRDRRDSTEILSSIACPTLVLGGVDDQPAPIAVMHEMANQIHDATHVVIPNAGHLPNLEQPETFNREVGLFLGGIK